jgi:hypothetical protein
VSDKAAAASSSGAGATGLLGVLFVGLKLTHYIDWSWWWVTAPFWAPMVLLVALLILYFLVMAVLAMVHRAQQ